MCAQVKEPSKKERPAGWWGELHGNTCSKPAIWESKHCFAGCSATKNK
jgi:hypothetical protein